MIRSFHGTLIAILALGCVGACNKADNPKLAEVDVPKIKVDTSIPKKTGDAKPYGANKKYQDMMNK